MMLASIPASGSNDGRWVVNVCPGITMDAKLLCQNRATSERSVLRSFRVVNSTLKKLRRYSLQQPVLLVAALPLLKFKSSTATATLLRDSYNKVG